MNPPNRYDTKGQYTELRKFLINDGYLLLQSEVYMRVEDSRKSCAKHLNRIKSFLPTSGTVRLILLTEKQFSSCILVQEKPDFQEQKVGNRDFVIFEVADG